MADKFVKIMPCLDMQNGRVVKGVHFIDIADAGDPVECAKAYCAAGADELAMLGISGDNFFKLVVAVTMPGTITAEGATITENTASFTITDLDEEQVLTVESASTNVAGMIAVGIAVIVLIVILILVFGRKKPQQNRF